MARVAVLELTHDLASAEVPHLNALVVRRGHETSRRRVEGERADEQLVSDECLQAFARGRAPDLDLAVIGPAHDEVILQYLG